MKEQERTLFESVGQANQGEAEGTPLDAQTLLKLLEEGEADIQAGRVTAWETLKRELWERYG